MPDSLDRLDDGPMEGRYFAGVAAALPEDAALAARERSEGASRREPEEPFALRGAVLTPGERLDDGHVLVVGGEIAAVGAGAPAGVRTIDTGGVILPGLIDLHGHPEYNVFAAWEPPKLYANRSAWRRSKEYRQVVRAPWTELTDEQASGKPSLIRSLTRYAEARALVGGATAIQGASGRYPDQHEGLVRNVDLRIFGEHRARSIVDLDRASEDELTRKRQQIDAGEVNALYVHLAEGTDARSRREFDELKRVGLLTEATAIIHGTALTRAQLEEVREAGASLVWSPQSNLRLYEQTTDAAHALSIGTRVALGADWLPSGSPSLLDELRLARRVLRQQGSRVEPKRLVEAVTSEAAAVAGLGDRLGRLEAGRPADVLVLERRHQDPYESVVDAERSSVELVTIGGDIAYGRADWVTLLAGASEAEPVVAWGKQMALDLTYSVIASGSPPPRLADLRAELLARFPQTGPIFA